MKICSQWWQSPPQYRAQCLTAPPTAPDSAQSPLVHCSLIDAPAHTAGLPVSSHHVELFSTPGILGTAVLHECKKNIYNIFCFSLILVLQSSTLLFSLGQNPAVCPFLLTINCSHMMPKPQVSPLLFTPSLGLSWSGPVWTLPIWCPLPGSSQDPEEGDVSWKECGVFNCWEGRKVVCKLQSTGVVDYIRLWTLNVTSTDHMMKYWRFLETFISN